MVVRVSRTARSSPSTERGGTYAGSTRFRLPTARSTRLPIRRSPFSTVTAMVTLNRWPSRMMASFRLSTPIRGHIRHNQARDSDIQPPCLADIDRDGVLKAFVMDTDGRVVSPHVQLMLSCWRKMDSTRCPIRYYEWLGGGS